MKRITEIAGDTAAKSVKKYVKNIYKQEKHIRKKLLKDFIEKSGVLPRAKQNDVKYKVLLYQFGKHYIRKLEIRQDAKKAGSSSSEIQKATKASKSKEEKNEITDPRLLKYLIGPENTKFFVQNRLQMRRVVDFVDGVKMLHEVKQTDKISLFSDYEDIFMQITCFKIPKTPTRQLRLILPRMIISKEDSVLLFVRDMQKGKKNVEKSEAFFRQLLSAQKIKMVTEVMCLSRLKQEYDQFELKRKLLNSYEMFLVDGRISGHVAHFLGKIFTKKRKLPTPIKMDAEDLNEEVMKALRRTVLPLHATGDCYTLRIGTTNMESKHIAENFRATCTQLAKLFPGGWDNIQCIRIKSALSQALPIYNAIRADDPKVPVVAPKRPKAYANVEGELTTLTYDEKVIITPEGQVTVVKKDKENNETKKNGAKQEKEDNEDEEEQMEDQEQIENEEDDEDESEDE